VYVAPDPTQAHAPGMERVLSRMLVSLVVGAVGLVVAHPAAAAPQRVTVWFGMSADPTPFYGGVTMPSAPPQLGFTTPHDVDTAICKLNVTPGDRPDAIAVLEAARAKGCIRSYALSASPSATGGAHHVVQAINGVANRWVLYENGIRPDYYDDEGIEGFHADEGDRVAFRLAPVKVDACCL
jgi:hypothetical protein